MKRHWIERVLELAILMAIIIAGFGQAVLHLWNWLVPSIFGLQRISFWQAVGLLGLCWILFGQGFLGRPGYSTTWRRRIQERWSQMTPEERQKVRAGLQGRCGHFEPPPTQPKV
jgi:fatty acid desaturase